MRGRSDDLFTDLIILFPIWFWNAHRWVKTLVQVFAKMVQRKIQIEQFGIGDLTFFKNFKGTDLGFKGRISFWIKCFCLFWVSEGRFDDLFWWRF